MIIHNSIDYPKLLHSRALSSPASSPPTTPVQPLQHSFSMLSALPPSLSSSSSTLSSAAVSSSNASPLSSGSSVEPVLVFVNRGVYFPRRKVSLTFISVVSEVLADFGAPESVRAKSEQEDKMSIYSNFPPNHPSAANLPMIDNNLPQTFSSSLSNSNGMPISALTASNNTLCDYFFFYPVLGFCLLFDGGLHRIKKIILFTNLPASPYFGRFHKCHFKIVDVDGKVTSAQQPNLTASTNIQQQQQQQQQTHSAKKNVEPYTMHRVNSASGTNESPVKNTNDTTASNSSSPTGVPPFQVDCNSRWSDIHRHFHSLGFPYRHPHGPLVHTLPSHIHPFSPTLFYAYKGIVFEIHSKNEYIASIQLFHDALTFVSANNHSPHSGNTPQHQQSRPISNSNSNNTSSSSALLQQSSGSVIMSANAASMMNGASDGMSFQSKGVTPAY